MGYMGLGMQKWIYTQRPRKLFSKRIIQSVDTIEKYSAGNLNIEGRTYRNNLSKESKKIVIDRISRRYVNGKILNVIIAVTLIILTVTFILYIEPWKAESQNEQYLKNQLIKERIKKTQTFDLSLSYGKNYLKKAEYDQAIKEFHFALKIFPENKEATEYLVKAYVQDCKVNERNCEKAIEILDKLIGENPNNFEYQSYRISLEMKT